MKNEMKYIALKVLEVIFFCASWESMGVLMTSYKALNHDAYKNARLLAHHLDIYKEELWKT